MRVSSVAAVTLTAFAIAACRPARLPAKEYVYPSWGFKASFQTQPVIKDEPASADGSTPHNFLAEAHTHDDDFVVTACECSQSPTDVDGLSDYLGSHFAKGVGGQVASKTYVATFENLFGREIQISKDGKPFATLRVFAVGGRSYQVIAVSNYGPSDPAVVRFLYSFHALDANGDVTNNIAPAAPASNAPSSR
jgi:hypothetical protein